MKTKRWPVATRRAVAVLGGLLLSTLSGWPAMPWINDIMTYGIGSLDYNPYTKRVVWWSGQGRCLGENPAPAKVSVLSDLNVGRDDFTGMACGGAIEGVTSDEAFAYLIQGGIVWRFALGAPPDTYVLSVPVAFSQGFTPTAIARFGDWLFWVESDGSFSKLWKADQGGMGGQQLVGTGFWGRVRKLRVFYNAGSFRLVCCMLADNGQLFKGAVDPVGSFTMLANNIVDFDMRVEGSSGGGLLPFYRVFAIQPPHLLAIHFNNGTATAIYTNEFGKNLSAVAVDDRRVYIIENSTRPCGPNGELACPTYFLLRQDRPLDDFTPRPWVAFGGPVENDVYVTHNPRSLVVVGTLLMWADGRVVRRISADAPPIQLNFVPVGMEIVQAIQNLNNDVPLVQGKPTFVRAHARSAVNQTGKTIFFPAGVLKVFGRQSPFLPFQELATLNPVQLGRVDDESDLYNIRTNSARHFLFELPDSMTRFFQLQCEFTVNSDRGYLENVGSNPYDDNTAISSAVFLPIGDHQWVFVAMKTAPRTYYPQEERKQPAFWSIIERARSLLPVANVQVECWRDVIRDPRGMFTQDESDDNFPLNSRKEWDGALERLQGWTFLRSRPGPCTSYIGTVDPSAGSGSSIAGNGAMPPWFANSSMSKMQTTCVNPTKAPWACPRGGIVVAHELGHNAGRDHVNCPMGVPEDPDSGYPYPIDMITMITLRDPAAEYGFDPITRRAIDPRTTADLMSYCQPSWISDYTWEGVMFEGNPPCSLRKSAASTVPTTLLVLAGTVDLETDRVEFLPGYVVPPGVVDETLLPNGGDPGVPYSLRLRDSQGNTLNEVPLALGESSLHTTVRGFAHALPLPMGLQSVQILRLGQVRAERYLTAHDPVLSLLAPQVDLNRGTLECDWTASDADGDPLVFTVQYSPDGAGWLPLQVASPNNALRVDARELPGGPQALLRVIASDGLRCAVATSDPFTVPNSTPAAVILGVQEGDRLSFGSSVPVTGIGHDHEDGMLEQLAWTISGPTSGTAAGSRLLLGDLTPGDYTLTLSATDGGGLAASNTVHFTVLPLFVPERPAPELDGLCADEAYVDALEVPFNFGWPRPAYARLSHADAFLHVAFSGLPFSPNTNSPFSIGLVVDTDWSRGGAPQTNDVGFFVDESGVPLQRRGDGSAMVLNLEPSLGVQTAISRGENAWSAELKIPDRLVGGWGHEAGVVIYMRDRNNVFSQTWPAFATTAAPDTWVPALFGVAAPASNQPPVAVASGPRVQTINAPTTILLNGDGSFDPEGQPLTYHWSQLAGPTVTLSNAMSASPSFLWSPTNVAADFRFRLVVGDGALQSLPGKVDLTIYSSALNPQPLPPDRLETTSGVVSGALNWLGIMGDRAVVEASQNLEQWVPIGTNTVDFDGRVHFRDPDAWRYSQRFYRARGIASSSSIVYSNDFEGTVGGEWTPRAPVDATPIGNRHFLGQFATETVTLGLSALSVHTRVHVSCDLFIIRTWDGNHPELGPDRWQLQVRGGATLVDATFSTYWNQSYPGALGDEFPPRTGAVENDTLGYSLPGFGGFDSVYHFDFAVDHSGASLTLDFSGIGLQSIDDESWGLDNVQVELINNP